MSAAMVCKGLLLLALNGLGALAAGPLTATYIKNTMEPAIVNMLQSQNPPLDGPVLRLSFHDCAGAGGCDGCLNLNLAENAGLGPVVDQLETLLATPAFSGLITRSDLWALAARVVVNRGVRRGQNPPQQADFLPHSSFTTGRVNCASGQFKSTNDVSANFPSATLGSAGVTDYFSKNFGFTAQQAVAIMGAHHIGAAHVQNSGFRGPWVPPPGALDGRYYAEMTNAGRQWTQQVANRGAPVAQQKYQWQPSAANAPNIMMLPADMALFKQSVPDAQGKVSCPYSGAGACGLAPTSNLVTRYANPNNRATFLSDFAAVFVKMQTVCGRSGVAAVYCTAAKLKTVAP